MGEEGTFLNSWLFLFLFSVILREPRTAHYENMPIQLY